MNITGRDRAYEGSTARGPRRVLLASLAVAGAAAAFVLGTRFGDRATDATTSASPPLTTAPTLALSTPPDVTAAQLAVLRERQDNLDAWTTWALLPLAVVTSVLGAGGVVGIVLSFRNEIRAGQAHDLLVSGESAQQARTEEVHAVLLDASQKTLTLVNDTLELARDASERAAKTLSQRAERLLGDIGQEASSLFLAAYHHPQFVAKGLKLLVEEPEIRNEILDLAQRLASIEGYLEFQEIPLNASAFLVKGMAHHFKQDEKRAIQDLERAAELKESTNPKLKQVAYYWAGYSCTNVGQFSQAAVMFASAKRFADPASSLLFELSRLEEESRFFELTRRFFEQNRTLNTDMTDDVDRVLSRVKAITEEAHSAEQERSAESLAVVAGNISFWLARASEDPAKAPALEQANRYYEKAGESLWASFSRAEVQRELHPRSRGVKKTYAAIEQLANAETQKRTEPRSVTLLHLTTLICMKRQGKPKAEIEGVRRLLWSAFASVDNSVTLFSQHWKTNITKEQFRESDLEPLDDVGVAPRRRTP